MRSIREICVKDHGEEEVRGWGYRPLGDRWKQAIRDGYVWVVERDEKIEGHGYIRVFQKDGVPNAHIHGLYLTSAVLGQGLGLKLAHLMLDTARRSGVKLVTLESTLTAHQFYKKLGFRDTAGLQKMEIAGYSVRYYPMELRLE
ncbi:MAG TPA: GNAT family N-acetyltransferase [Bdellovibrionales bacterium]|nr:GNAT family N-acetyltransferase [Bdellovibrionales bacterium]